MNTFNKLLAAFALLVTAGMGSGCGVPTEAEEPIAMEETAAALMNTGGYTTRDICKACGCVASDVACDCGTPPRKKKLECIDNGGPTKLDVGSVAASASTTSLSKAQ